MTKPKTLEQLRAEKERAETQLAQEQHKLERLENRKKYLEKGERTKRTHRLCNLGGTIGSLSSLCQLLLYNTNPAKTNLPDGTNLDTAAECARYNGIIHKLGGIDLQLLGIGPNGHIGFNEPGQAFKLETHCIDLAPTTIEANKRFFDGNEALVPKQAYTMGIKTIMQARKVLVVANGKAKAQAVKDAVTGPVTPACPGSILQLHPDCILVADEEALSLL